MTRRLQRTGAPPPRSHEQSRVVWTPALSVGVGAIDRDHQRMFALYEAVSSVIRGRGDRPALAGALDELVEYTRTHFAREELWMRRVNYPGLDTHTREHHDLIAKVQRLREQGATRTIVAALETLRLLSLWIPNHIERTDLALGEYLRSAGVSEP